MLPKRVIDGHLTDLERGHGLSVDPIHNEVAVTSDLAGAIYVYSRTANGNVAPLRKIQGDRTQLVFPEDVFIDPVHDEIVVNNQGDRSILFFSRTANGNIPPLRAIKGPATRLVLPWGLWVNTQTGELWTTSALNYFSTSAEATEYERQNSPAILMFSRMSNGNVAPERRIYGDLTNLGNPRVLAFDTKNNEIFVVSFSTEPGKSVHSPSTLESYITVFDMRQSGNIAPKRILRPNTFSNPSGIFVSPEHDEIGVEDGRNNMILTFPRVW